MSIRKKSNFRIQVVKKNIPLLYKVQSSTLTFSKTKNLKDMRPPPRPQQRSQFINASLQTPILRSLAPVGGKKKRNLSSDRPPLQITLGNSSKFTTPAKF